MNPHWLRRLGMLVPAFTLLAALGASSVSADPLPHEAFQQQQQSIAELSQLSGQEFEIGYINRIVPHHQGALQMAQIIQQKAVNQQLRDDAGMMIQEQQSEIQQLTNYLNSTYGQDVAPDPRFVMDPAMVQELRNASPENAEIMFLLMMREHHQSAIDLGQLVADRTDTSLLIDQAAQMIDSQRTQQAQFTGYLSDWYGIDAPEPTGDMQAAMDFAMNAMMPGMPSTGGGGTAATGQNGRLGLMAAALASLALIGGAIGYLVYRRAG